MGSDFQRTLMWVILVAACFMLWDNWQVYNGRPSFFSGSTETVQATQQEAQAGVESVPDAVGSGASAVAKGMIQASDPIEVKSDLLKLNIDEQGAVVTRAELLKEQQQAEWTEVGLAGKILGNEAPKLNNIVMFDVTPKHVYVAQSGLIGGDFPNHKSPFKYVGTKVEKKLDAEQNKTVNFKEYKGIENLAKAVEDALGGHMADFAFQCTGSPAGHSNIYKFIRKEKYKFKWILF